RDHLVGRTAQARVLDVSRLGQRRRRSLTDQAAIPLRGIRVVDGRVEELAVEKGIVVARQGSVQQAVGEPERPGGGGDAELQQPAILRHRTGFGETVAGRGLEGQERIAPHPIGSLTGGYRRYRRTLDRGGQRLSER